MNVSDPDGLMATEGEIAARQATVGRALRSVARKDPYIQIVTTAKRRVLCAQIANEPLSDYRSWTFPSFVEGVSLHYHEQWDVASLDTSVWRLGQVHFHVIGTNTGDELVALHCEAQGVYPLRPHVHVTAASYPLDKAHFVTELTADPDAVRSLEFFESALSSAIQLIESEVLSRPDLTQLVDFGR